MAPKTKVEEVGAKRQREEQDQEPTSKLLSSFNGFFCRTGHCTLLSKSILRYFDLACMHICFTMQQGYRLAVRLC
jgi:hypothetical protein